MITVSSAKVLIVLLEIQLPSARSLKDKRQILNSVKGRLSHRHNVSVAETGMQEKWQRAQLGMTMISTDEAFLYGQAEKFIEIFESHPEIIVLEKGTEIISASG